MWTDVDDRDRVAAAPAPEQEVEPEQEGADEQAGNARDDRRREAVALEDTRRTARTASESGDASLVPMLFAANARQT